MAIDPQSKPMDMEGKAVLVTGAASGIGRAIALRMSALGGKVIVADINEEGGQETVGMVEGKGGEARFVRCDVTSLDDARSTVAETRKAFGRIDALINNAGWDLIEPFMNNDPAIWDKVISINLKGPINMSRAALEAFKEQESGGKIVNLASDAGRVGSMGEAVYSACKGGVIALTKTLAREGVRSGVMVNSVAPGITDTPLIHVLDENIIGKIVKTIPMRRMGDPDEVAEMVVFLASNSNTYMTGQIVSVSGGLTMV